MAEAHRQLRHVQVASSLGDEIARGRWRVGTRLPATRLLARQYRTSLSTVQAALGTLNEEGLVESRHGSGVYVTGLPVAPTNTPLSRVGVIIPTQRHFEMVLDGIGSVLSPRGVAVSVVVTRGQVKAEIDAVSHLLRAGADALIIAPIRDLTAEDPLWRDVLVDLEVPAVLVERQPPDVPECRISHVTSDLRRGTRDAVEHLMSHGRHQLALYAPGLYGLWLGVIEGFVEAAHRVGAPLQPELIQTGPRASAPPDEFARRCVEYGADAVFAAHEPETLQLLPELRRLGLSTPGDIAVMELCDTAAAGHSLSGIRLPRHEIGATAARLLVDRSETGPGPTCHINFRPQLFLRDSCGPHPT